MGLSACGGGSGAPSAAGGDFAGAPSYAVGGTVSGLGASTTLLLNGDTSHAITQAADGSFTFSQPVAYGASYTVTVGTQPTDMKYCQVSNGTGTVTAAVSNVTVSCAAGTWVVTAIATQTDTFPADPVLDPVNAANNVVRNFPASNLAQSGYVDINGNYYFAMKNNVIYKITNTGLKTSFLLGAGELVFHITGNAAGDIYFLGGASTLTKVSGASTTRICSSLGFSFTSGMVFDDASNTIYVSDTNMDTVYSLNPTTCVKTAFSSGIYQAAGVNLYKSTSLVVYSGLDGIRAISKNTGIDSGTALNNSTIPITNYFATDASENIYLSARSVNAIALKPDRTQVVLAPNVSTSGDQIGIGRNANGDIYLTLKVSQKIIKLSRP